MKDQWTKEKLSTFCFWMSCDTAEHEYKFLNIQVLKICNSNNDNKKYRVFKQKYQFKKMAGGNVKIYVKILRSKIDLWQVKKHRQFLLLFKSSGILTSKFQPSELKGDQAIPNFDQVHKCI